MLWFLRSLSWFRDYIEGMSKFKPKYKWRDREQHFQWLRLMDANRESRMIWGKQWQEDMEFLRAPFFSLISQEKIRHRFRGFVYIPGSGSAVDERPGTTIPGKSLKGG